MKYYAKQDVLRLLAMLYKIIIKAYAFPVFTLKRKAPNGLIDTDIYDNGTNLNIKYSVLKTSHPL